MITRVLNVFILSIIILIPYACYSCNPQESLPIDEDGIIWPLNAIEGGWEEVKKPKELNEDDWKELKDQGQESSDDDWEHVDDFDTFSADSHTKIHSPLLRRVNDPEISTKDQVILLHNFTTEDYEGTQKPQDPQKKFLKALKINKQKPIINLAQHIMPTYQSKEEIDDRSADLFLKDWSLQELEIFTIIGQWLNNEGPFQHFHTTMKQIDTTQVRGLYEFLKIFPLKRIQINFSNNPQLFINYLMKNPQTINTRLQLKQDSS